MSKEETKADTPIDEDAATPFLGFEENEGGFDIGSGVTAGFALAATGLATAALFYIARQRCFKKTDTDFERI